MAKIDVVKIGNKEELEDFISLPYSIYRDCAQYVPDLEVDIREFLDPKENPSFDFCNIQPFVAYREGAPVGRIVGIVNHKANERWQTRNVRFTFIEFIDDKEVSDALICAVEQWGKTLGMDKIEGPMGATDFDKEGMLVEDFNLAGTVNTFYNHAYYPQHLEAMGFEKEVDWVQIRIKVPQEVPARYARTSQYVREQLGLRVVKLTNEDIKKRNAGRKVFDLLNEAYAPLFGFAPFSDEQIDLFIKKYMKLMDKQLLTVVVNEKNEFVGVAITMVSLTRAMQKAKGHIWPLGWWYLLNAVLRKREKTVEMMLVAVRPDYQGLGVNALFFDDLIPIYNKYGFETAETLPQLETNVRELSQWKPLNPEYVKRRRCYIKTI